MQNREYPDFRSPEVGRYGDVSSAWNLCAHSSDVIFAGKPVLAS